MFRCCLIYRGVVVTQPSSHPATGDTLCGECKVLSVQVISNSYKGDSKLIFVISEKEQVVWMS